MAIARDVILWSFVGAAAVLIIRNSKGFVSDWNAVAGSLTAQTRVLSGQG